MTQKEYRADPRKAHDGTIKYVRRNAHIECTSGRRDMEVLGFNVFHWLVGYLPWQGILDNLVQGRGIQGDEHEGLDQEHGGPLQASTGVYDVLGRALA